MGRSRTFLGDKDQISSGEHKKKGYGVEAKNGVFSWNICIIKQDTNFISQTVGHTNF